MYLYLLISILMNIRYIHYSNQLPDQSWPQPEVTTGLNHYFNQLYITFGSY